VEKMEAVGTLINCLTNNEDLRQDLWVHYLSGNPTDSLVTHLQKISDDYSEDLKVKHAIWQLISSPLSEKFPDFLSSFTEFEQSIICLLMLGLSIQQISKHEGISEVRIRQTVSSIRYNVVWRQFYGIEEAPDR
jgi:hypothetical protein